MPKNGDGDSSSIRKLDRVASEIYQDLPQSHRVPDEFLGNVREISIWRKMPF